jgi:hypothetical protein
MTMMIGHSKEEWSSEHIADIATTP